VQRLLNQINPYKNTIFCGDLNAYHSWWNSSVTGNNNTRTQDLINWLEKYEFELLNNPDQQTCNRSDNSIIDLTFVTKNLNELLINWEISNELKTGSDHEIILFSINIDNGNLVENPLYNSQYNFKKAD
jgi:Endonuclease-reverse transcriptase